MPKIAQLLAGMVLGALAYAPPVFIIYLMTAGTGRGAAGAATAIAILLPFFMAGTVIMAVIIQAVTTGVLTKRGNSWAAAGVWLAYPTAFAAVLGYWGYVELRTNLAAQEDYSNREISVTVGEVRNILFSDPQAFKSGFDGLKFCQRTCLSALKAGALDSIAIPADGYFKLYRLDRGEACKEARQNFLTFLDSKKSLERITHDREMIGRELNGLKQQLENLPNFASGKGLEERTATKLARIAEVETELAQANKEVAISEAKHLAIWRKPAIEINRVRGGGELADLGYFNQCVTAAFVEDYDYDIQIRSGRELARPYGTCCAIAEIYERSKSGPRLVARWEGSHYDETSFTVLQIVERLTKIPIEYMLPPRHSDGIEAELSVLRETLGRGGYLPDWSNIRTRLMSVVGQQYRESSNARLTLRDEEIDTFMRLTHGLREKGHDLRFNYFERYLDADSYARLKEADAARELDGKLD